MPLSYSGKPSLTAPHVERLRRRGLTLVDAAERPDLAEALREGG